ncbi:hypothetical protein ACTQXY_05050 [Faecalimonas sp. LCP19S3_D12]
MFEKVNYIELSGDSYPLKCDILVLEKIQEEYGDLTEFENNLTGFVPKRDEEGEIVRNEEGFMVGAYGIPDAKTLRKALMWMIQEGLEIEGAQMEITEVDLARKVDMSPVELGRVLRDEFSKCFKRKNGETTQRETEETQK